MIPLKTKAEIELLRQANQIVAEARDSIRAMAEPGITTLELDEHAEKLMAKRGAKPAFKGYRGFPATICVSINNEVVHGIPGKRKLKEGDLVSVDLGSIFEGFYGDSALSFAVGQVSEEAERLMRVTRESLYKGIEAAQPGNRLHDISAAVQEHCEAQGFSIVKDFVGHGIGRALHEDPQVPNFGTRGTGPKLQPGMVLAIEPMVNAGGAEVQVLDDGWTAVTRDGSLSAHFEHSIAITEDGPVILSEGV